MDKIRAQGTAGLVTVTRRTGLGTNGALLSCKNIHSKEPGIYQQREGQVFTDAAPFANSYNRLFYDPINQQTWRAGTSVLGMQRYNGSAWQTAIATSVNVAAHAVTNKTNYFLTDQGLRRLEGTSSLDLAGPMEALDPVFGGTSASGWLQGPAQVGYKVLIGLKRADGTIEYGAPSGAFTFYLSTAVAINPGLYIPVPREATTSHFYQVYRTTSTESLSVQPDAYYYLVYEDYFTAGQISSRYFLFYDTVPEGGGGQALYTNPDLFSSSETNLPCEAAIDTGSAANLAVFDRRLFAGPYKPRSSLTFSILALNTSGGLNLIDTIATSSIGSNVLTAVPLAAFANMKVGMLANVLGFPARTTITAFNSGAGTVTLSNTSSSALVGVNVTFGDSITIAGTTYYASNGTDAVNGYFEVFTDPGMTISNRIAQTALSLCWVINVYASNTAVYARYASDPLSTPGDIFIWARTDRASTYTISSIRGEAFGPNLTTPVTIPSISSSSTIVFSREDRPYAFPPENTLTLPDNAIVRSVITVRSTVAVLTDRGVYRILGSGGNYFVEALDLSIQASIQQPEFVGGTALNNLAFFRTQQGIVAVSDSGVEIVSRNVNNFIANAGQYYGGLGANLADGFLYVPLQYATLVYHAYQGIWTMYEGATLVTSYDPLLRCVFFSYSDGVYNAFVSQDAYDFKDGIPESVTITVVDPATNTITFSSPLVLNSPGYVVRQGSIESIIKELPTSSSVVVQDVTGFTVAAAQVYATVDANVVYCPIALPDASVVKRGYNANILFDGALLSSGGLTSGGEISFDSSTSEKYVQFTVATDLTQTVSSNARFVSSPNYPHFCREAVPFGSSSGSVFTAGVRLRGNVLARLVGVEISDERPRR